MATAFRPNATSRFGVPPVRYGYDGPSQPTNEVTVPSVTITDVDESIFNRFDKEFPLFVNTKEEQTKIGVMFASGERWAMLKKNKGLRDKNGSLILPLLTIVRGAVTQERTTDIAGRGISSTSGELVIKRQTSASDRQYQNLINKSLIKNQGLPEQSTLLRDVGELTTNGVIQDGGLLLSDRRNSITEIVTIPAPQFFTVEYEITIWCQYTTQMNDVFAQLMASMLFGNTWKLETTKGYWFVAFVQANYSSGDNSDEYAGTERVIKRTINVKVPAYSLVAQIPGAPVPVRIYRSAPDVNFIVADAAQTTGIATVEEPFLGSDDPTLPMSEKRSRRADQRDNQGTLLYPNIESVVEQDPALKNIPRAATKSRYRKITSVDRLGNRVVKYARNDQKKFGEGIVRASDLLDGLDIVSVDE